MPPLADVDLAAFKTVAVCLASLEEFENVTS